MEVFALGPVLKRILRFLPSVGRDSKTLALTCKKLTELCVLYREPSFFTPQQLKLLSDLDQINEPNWLGNKIIPQLVIAGGHGLGRSSMVIYKAFEWAQQGKRVAICIPEAHLPLYLQLLASMQRRFVELKHCQFEQFVPYHWLWGGVFPCVSLIIENKEVFDEVMICDRVFVDGCKQWLKNGILDSAIPVVLRDRRSFIVAVDSTLKSTLFSPTSDVKLSGRPRIQLEFRSMADQCAGCRLLHRLNLSQPPDYYATALRERQSTGKTIVAVNDHWCLEPHTKNPRKYACPTEPYIFGLSFKDNVIQIDKTMSVSQRTSLMLLFAAQENGILIVPALFLRQCIPLHCSRLIFFNTFHGPCRLRTKGKLLDPVFFTDIMNTVHRRDSPYPKLDIQVYDTVNANFLYFYALQYQRGIEVVSGLFAKKKTKNWLLNAPLHEIRAFCTENSEMRQLY